jgi:site-specific recombinase XerD
MLLYTGCRVGDLVNLELHDLMLSDRSGSVVFRFGKGNKQRSVPLPLLSVGRLNPATHRQVRTSRGMKLNNR